jgi:hypothetical protein
MVTALLMSSIGVAAQGRPPGQEPPPPPAPLQVQIVISHYLNDKRLSTLPFWLSMNTSASVANVRFNGDVPMPNPTFTPAGDGKPANVLTSYTFKSVGTNIDVQNAPSLEGRIGLRITVSETSVRPSDAGDAAKTPVPMTQNYQSLNTVQLKDGEATQFTAATDRVTGEVVRVEVTAKVLK